MTTASGSCERVREDLEALHYGDLEGEDRRAAEAHLESCAACRAALEAVRETAAQLDQVPVPKPSELDWARFDRQLEARVGPLRTRRVVSPWLRRERLALLAASVLIGGLSIVAGGLFLEVRGQQTELAMLRVEVAEQSFRAGDLQRWEWLVRAPEIQSAPSVRTKIEALEKVGDDDLARLWLSGEKGVSEEEVRGSISEVLVRYPKHPLAEQAAIAFEKKGIPRLPPLERAILSPIPFIPVQPLPGETREQTLRKKIEQLRQTAAGAHPKAAAGLIFQAAEIAEEELRDAALAAELYERAGGLVKSGKVHDESRKGLSRVQNPGR